jgi:DUF4097 and DUF4098 domain-containing protein YvlB
MKHTILLICAAVAAWGQAPPPKLTCDGPLPVNDGLVPYCEMRETSVAFSGSVAVNTGGSGEVLVQSWDGADILVRSKVLTDGETMSLAVMLAAIVGIDTSDGNVTGTGPSSEGHRNWSLSLEIYVPRKLGLSVTTLNGNVSVQDLEGQPGITLATLNGNVSATGVVGPLQLRTTNGNITTAGGAGPIQFNAVNGKASLTGVAGDVQGNVVNGSILVAADRWVGQTIDVTTVNGAIELDVPSDCSAHAELSTVIGAITTNVPVPASNSSKSRGRTPSFDIGGGGALIRASLVHGVIKLTRLD